MLFDIVITICVVLLAIMVWARGAQVQKLRRDVNLLRVLLGL
ncbi:hypothetical protein [Sphingomonas sp. HMP6]|nr:hypothetical protein [Sphingomonas sp. HMP6]BCA57675.1 hypothetical protein HMP06_0444 [Sphingomonas sp. HMP6]